MKRDGEAILIFRGSSSMHRAEQVCRNGSFNKILSLYTGSFSHACGQRLYIWPICSNIHSVKCFNIEFFNLQPVCLKCWLVPWGLYIHNKCFHIQVCFRIVIFLFCSVLRMLPESIILRKWAFQLNFVYKTSGGFYYLTSCTLPLYLELKDSFWRR
jgi:hypothetical protein